VIKHHQGPMIITGDFNTWNQDRIDIVSEMSSLLKMSAVEYEDDRRLTVFRNPVDHVYFRGLEILNANTESVESSDHNPMLVTFRMASL
jgi:endonuclease/exonuclease/phosphatase (EEP) superfamily protein YafD